MATYSIGELGKRFGVSRATLLYYDRIGLLSATGRSPSGYRLYNESDAARLAKIRHYRAGGLSLEAIKRLLADGTAAGEVAELIGQRVEELNRTIQNCRRQQRLLLSLLPGAVDRLATRSMNKEQWVELLRRSGMEDGDMLRWHQEFESLAPEAHQDFLESLGIDADEIEQIRIRSAS